MKKILTLISIFTFTFVLVLPLAVADCVDNDRDRYYADDGAGCAQEDLPIGAKGIEEARCNFLTISTQDSNQPEANLVYNPDIAGATVNGRNINPGAIEVVDNGIDENCDGKDGKIISANTKNADEVIQNVINILGYYVLGPLCVLIVTWGGIMYATAAGNEEKMSKARKAIIGALIGAVIGFSAPTIVSYFLDKFTS